MRKTIFCQGSHLGRSGRVSILAVGSEPEIAHAALLGWKVFKRVQAVEMIDRQILNEIRRRKPDVDGHAPAAILSKPQAAPAQDTGAGWAEQDFERRLVPVGAGVGGGLTGESDALSFVIISPQRAVASAERAVAGGDRARSPSSVQLALPQ